MVFRSTCLREVQEKAAREFAKGNEIDLVTIHPRHFRGSEDFTRTLPPLCFLKNLRLAILQTQDITYPQRKQQVWDLASTHWKSPLRDTVESMKEKGFLQI
ncbi:unnamed protein product [Malus baccata var. baccata]